jgi:transcriptional regulator NrdR family protein
MLIGYAVPEYLGDPMVKVRKRSGKLQAFMKSKIVKSCKKAGATTEEAKLVAKEVSKKVAKKKVVSAQALLNMVVASLKKTNKRAASAYAKFGKKKLKKKKK